MLARAAAALTLLAAATAHDDGMPINPALGVPGFPDCTRLNPTIDMTVGEAAMDQLKNRCVVRVHSLPSHTNAAGLAARCRHTLTVGRCLSLPAHTKH